ncbi:sand protein-related [Anaeramoeba flamelloides]|uniref:Sand protein-related n=1 Tax=Anaeramoeba flamelloides TaxID=1746091 RepID=A0AAV8AAN4_9EUKA|nr:sand protein-related [Anaeramoeba flamelloides]
MTNLTEQQASEDQAIVQSKEISGIQKETKEIEQEKNEEEQETKENEKETKEKEIEKETDIKKETEQQTNKDQIVVQNNEISGIQKETKEIEQEKNEEEQETKENEKEKEQEGKEGEEKKEEEKEEEEEENISSTQVGEEDLKKNAENFNQQLSQFRGRRYQKHEEEGLYDEKWRNHKKHYLVLTQAGKPIYTRYGSSSKLSSFICVPQALVAFVTDLGDEIKSLKAGKHNIVFDIKGPIILVCVSKLDESTEQILKQLKYLYSQIVFFLSIRGIEMLNDRPQLDLRVYLGGTYKFFDSLIHRMNSYDFITDSTKFLKLGISIREKVANALLDTKSKFLRFAILSSDSGIIQLTQTKKKTLSTHDLFLLQNFSQDPAFRSNEIWSPLCLPDYNPKALVHAYLNYIDQKQKICLLFISLDPTGFMMLKTQCEKVVKNLEKDGTLDKIIDAVESAESFNVKKLQIKKLKHILYVNRGNNQCFTVKPSLPYSLKDEKKRLYSLYKTARSELLLNSKLQNKKYLSTSERETLLVTITDYYELYTVFHPLISKNEVNEGELQVLNFIKKNEESLFSQNIQFW